jgi:hypothetical protein
VQIVVKQLLNFKFIFGVGGFRFVEGQYRQYFGFSLHQSLSFYRI